MRPGDEETVSIRKTVPKRRGYVTAMEGRGVTGSTRPAQEAEEKGEIRQNLGSCFQGEEK